MRISRQKLRTFFEIFVSRPSRWFAFNIKIPRDYICSLIIRALVLELARARRAKLRRLLTL